MSQTIEQSTAKDFIDFYNETCLTMGEPQAEVTRCFVLERSAIEEIFSAAAEAEIQCEGIRIYLGKKSAFNQGDNYPKFSSKDDYNLVIVGVDENNENINNTGAIYDHCQSAAGLSGTPSGVDF